MSPLRRLALLPLPLLALADPQPGPAKPIEAYVDNSILLSEAYNQGSNEVQHTIVAGRTRHRDSDTTASEFTFSQEWPILSQRHQLGYEIPLLATKSGGRTHAGLGDLGLEYRYQAYFDEKTMTALAPAIGLTLPTGDAERGLGDNALGYSLGLPASTTIADRWSAHANLGVSATPNAGLAGDRRDLFGYSAGASVIYAASPATHLLLEYLGEWSRESGSPTEFTAVISPGVRHAINLDAGQLVLGAAVPLGLNRKSPDYGFFLYCSFEHAFADEN